MYVNKLSSFLTKNYFLIFIAIIIVGFYLRFYNIIYTFSFGWDQGRDAMVVRDILSGHLTLLGPRTGEGHIHLGPAYYYLLAPFYFITNLDPIASDYANIVFNIFNFLAIFYVTKKIFDKKTALFVLFIYAISHYLIARSIVPWNVTLMPGLAALIFYSIWQIYNEKYKFVYLMWLLSGFYFNIHFTAIFLPFLNIFSLIFTKDKKKVLLYSIYSIPLYFIWFVPNIIDAINSHGGDKFVVQNFFKNLFIGFHFRFLLHRLPDALSQFGLILYSSPFILLEYILPILFIIFTFFGKDKKKKIFGFLISLWFIVPLLGFTMYGGSLSDYYFLSSAPMVLFIIADLQNKLVKFNHSFLFVLFFVWIFYAYQNTNDLWIKPNKGGLAEQEQKVKNIIKNKDNEDYNQTIGRLDKYIEGDINSYLYDIYTKRGK